LPGRHGKRCHARIACQAPLGAYFISAREGPVRSWWRSVIGVGFAGLPFGGKEFRTGTSDNVR
jgi:hypothetical protein